MTADAAPPAYPETKKIDHVDTYHGVEIADPYRWLEQDVREAPEVAAWVEAQNAVTFDYLGKIPERAAIRERLTALWNYERASVPSKKGGRYFFRKNDGLQNQSVLYVQDSLAAAARVLIDPNLWSADGTVALGAAVPSDDGRLLAYSVAEAGSDWNTWRVLDVETGQPLADELKWVKFSGVSWTPDGRGFFYGRYPEPAPGTAFQGLALNMQLRYHRIGSPQSEDVVVFERPDHPEWGFQNSVTEDGRYLVITVWVGTDSRYQVFVRDLAEPLAAPVQLVGGFENEYSFVGNDGPRFYFQTDLDAPRRRLIAIDLRRPAREAWQEVIPQAEGTLESVSYVGRMFVATYLEHAANRVRVFGRDGQPVRDLDLGAIGSVDGFRGRSDDSETFFSFASFTEPGAIYRYDVATGEKREFFRPKVAFDAAGFEVEQVFYASKDGTKVPMFLVHRKGLKRDGSHPTLLYGYGGFNVSLTPYFSVARAVWLEMGGVLAVANLRGGGEYGEEWHQAGIKLKKQNTFDDFLAAAEWLIGNRITRPDRLAILGESNGGLLVGAAMTQRPELFGAALPAVGVMDMLRYHRFTAGRFWVDDYGSADDPEEFRVIRSYSPYHNLKPGTAYPATLVTTADTDDRVVPGHSFKFAAALQAAQAAANPVLIRIETRAGHGGGKPVAKMIEETADEWAFLAANLGMKLPPRFGAPVKTR
ncbi:MAG TPA: prolyl oligopeptidase family serine peptidase [Thermoanaerobaculia bacterium]|nr:prolyl oligopeptidase family serine peptidase [Thermoanaerobaculia bacterium]